MKIIKSLAVLPALLTMSSEAVAEQIPNTEKEAQVFFGIEFTPNNEKFTLSTDQASVDVDIKSTSFKLNVGAKKERSYLFTFLGSESHDEALYSSGESNLIVLGIGTRYDFIQEEFFNFFGTANIHAGYKSISGYSLDTAKVLGFDLGLGVSANLDKSVELYLKANYQGRNWTDVGYYYGYSYQEIGITSSSTHFSLGLNYYF